jgi:predicted pyridoxine 5'-phosphate oxidase superfamily flavin-nucleotide-binding protein
MADEKIEKYSDLFNKKAFANLGTLMKDGSPQVTPVWFDYDGKHIRVNSALGRVKDKNIRRDPLRIAGNSGSRQPISLHPDSRKSSRHHPEGRRRSH